MPAPLSRAFSRQQYWSGLPPPSSGDLPNPGTEPVSLVFCIARQVLYHSCHLGKRNLLFGLLVYVLVSLFSITMLWKLSHQFCKIHGVLIEPLIACGNLLTSSSREFVRYFKNKMISLESGSLNPRFLLLFQRLYSLCSFTSNVVWCRNCRSVTSQRPENL